MSPLTYDNNWRNVIQLDGKDIADGEFLNVALPEGGTRKLQVFLENADYETQDMNARVTISVRHAYVPMAIYGLVGKLRLPEGLMAERVE